MSDCSVVDENVDASDVRLGFRDHALHVGGDGHVGLNRDCLSSHPGDFGADRIRGVGTLTEVHGDIGTSPSHCDCNSGSDSATAASYKSNSILQVFHAVIVCARGLPVPGLDFCRDWTRVKVEDLYLPKLRASPRHLLGLESSHDHGIPPMPESVEDLVRCRYSETNKTLLPQRVSEAEEAVRKRGREIFYGNGTPEEKEALEDALYALRAFRTAWQHSEAA